jgi:hypothetical protein
MLRSTPRAVALLSAALAFAGCSSSSSPTKAGADGGTPADGGAAFTAGFRPDVGQIVPNGGPIIAAPKVVTVTWNADPNQAALEKFGDTIGASSYWRETTAEYGIGPVTSGGHVRIAAPPPATQDASLLDAWVADQLTNTATSGWPAWDPSTIYVIYIPTATQLSPHGATHLDAEVAGVSKHVPYALVDENGDGAGNGGKSALDVATAAAGHEIAEVATNPHLFSDLGIVGFDAKHVAWQMSIADAELADICEFNSDATFRGGPELPFMLQRMFSNKSAVAGHNPCVPAPAEPYYAVTPLDLETLSVFVDTAATAQEGWGYRVPIGTQKTIKLGFFSDQPLATPWTITAVEGNWFSPSTNARVSIAVGKASGNNGEIGEITVTANAQSTGAGNAVLVTVTAQAPGLAAHSVPILIGTY